MCLEPRIHYLKTHPVPFELAIAGRKAFTIRRDDRGYREGDLIVKHEWDPATGAFTGRSVGPFSVCSVTRNGPSCWALLDGYVVLGLAETGHPAELDLQRLGALLHDLAEQLGVAPVFGGIEEKTILTAAKRLRAKAGEDPRLAQALELVREAHASWMLGSAPKARDCSAQAARLLTAMVEGRA